MPVRPRDGGYNVVEPPGDRVTIWDQEPNLTVVEVPPMLRIVTDVTWPELHLRSTVKPPRAPTPVIAPEAGQAGGSAGRSSMRRAREWTSISSRAAGPPKLASIWNVARSSKLYMSKRFGAVPFEKLTDG